ncbi:MAG TPA: 30S ribosomal protein S20 [Candidatus Dormibacteraeota bacterium]|jgi:small subunit ribosomal protein S20|nr:30S ribosomal protein S20 [Candidatus Dormibacteraeota bacterium]
MANTTAAKKAMRQDAVRAARNRSLRSSVKTKITKFRRAAAAGEEIGELATTAIAALDRAASKGVLHPRNAARRKSRLAKRLNATQTESK